MKSPIPILIPLMVFYCSFLQAQDRGMKPNQVKVDKKFSQLDNRSKVPKALTINVGHSGDILSVAFSRDGKYIVSGGQDKTIKLWEFQSGLKIKTFIGHTDRVTSVAFSPDGKQIISGSYDGDIKLWDSQSGQEIKTLKGYHWHVTSVAFSPDGKQIISGGYNNLIKLWDSQSGEEIRTLKGHTDDVNSIAFSPDGKTIASGSRDSTIKLWDSQSGEEIRTLKGHTDDVNSIAFSSDGKYIVSGSNDETIKLWDSQIGIEIRTLKGHRFSVNSVAFSPDGKTIVSCGSGSMKFWESQSGEEIRSYEYSIFECVAFSPDGKYIVCGGFTTIKLWDNQSREEIKTMEGHIHEVTGVAFSPDRKYLVSWSYGDGIKLWNRQSGKTIRTLKGGAHFFVNSVAFSPDSKTIVSGAKEFREHITILWDIQTMEEIRRMEGHNDAIKSVAFSSDGKTIASGSRDSTIKLWDSQSGEEIRTLKGHTDDVNSIAFSPDGKTIASGSYDKNIILWNSQSGEKVNLLRSKRYNVYSVAYSPDGKYIVSGGSKEVTFWDLQSRKGFERFLGGYGLHGHYGRVNSVNVSPDGKYIISGNTDHSIKLWDSKSRAAIRTMEGHSSEVVSVAFSPNGSYIVSGSMDGTIKIWETETGELLVTLIEINKSEDYIAFTPDGRFDGTEKGMELLYYVEGMNIIPLASLYEQFYTPNLFARIMAGENFEAPEIKIDEIKLPPLVEIISPDNNSKLNKNEVKVTLTATDQGGGIDEIRIYLNGKLIETTQRGFKPVEQVKEGKTITFTISLVNGENKIKATAFSNQRTAAISDEITVFHDGVKKTVDLHLLIIGIDNYKNPNYNLNYALADAIAFKEEVEKGSKDIFGSVAVTFIKDIDATRIRILQEFNNLKVNAKQEDVFIFYYAGHGVMSVEDKSKFYLIPYDVTQLYGNNKILKSNAISENDLQDFSTELKAQKQLYIFDACQSGGMINLLAARSNAVEKAISQLEYSVGNYWLVASNSEQFATEFSELGHGLFTYTLLLGLRGQADGGSKDKRITVEELSAFIKNKLPELSEKHKGTPQYPTSYGYGQDFPIIIVE